MTNKHDPMNYYLQATEKLNNWDISKSASIISLLNTVIELDPHFYQAYIDLCNCYTWMGALNQISEVEAAAKVNHYLSFLKEQDHNLPEYYTMVAKRNFWVEWNIPTALRNCNRALKIQQHCADTILLKGLIVAASGNVTRGIQLLQQAERLAPLAKNINYFIGLLYHYSNSPEQALFYLNRNCTISTSWQQQYHEKLIVLCTLKRFTEAEQLITTLTETNHSKLFIAMLNAYFYASLDDIPTASENISIIEHALETDNDLHPYYFYLAELFVIHNNREKAFYYLEKSIRCKATPAIFTQINPLWDSYRSDPQLREILALSVPVQNNSKGIYSKSKMSNDQSHALLTKLNSVMEEKRPWLHAELTRKQLAKEVEITDHQLSQLLSNRVGKSFHHYCNHFRLQQFLKMVSQYPNSSMTLLQRALDCGFGSKTTFNTYFKKQMNTTPLRYLKSLKN